MKDELDKQLREFTQEEEERVNKLRQEVSEEKQRQLEELAKESDEKKKLLEDLGATDEKHAAAMAQHEAENKTKLDKLKREYEARERELEVQESRALEAKKVQMQDKVKHELADAERQLREANDAATTALRHKREQLQADLDRLEQEQKQRLAVLHEDHRRAALQLTEDRSRAGATSSAVPPQEPVGLRVTMDETYEEVEVAEGAFAAGLKADMAASVMASDSRFEWCGMQRGSVRALLNVLPDPTGRDSRSALALAESLKQQGSDAASSLRSRVVTKTVRLVEITAPGTRKQTSVQDWRALLPSSAPKSLMPSSEEALSLARRQAELDQLETEYHRRRQNLSLMEQRLKDEETRASRQPASDAPANADEDDKAARRRRRGPPEEVGKVLKEMKDDIQRRLAAVLTSREAYKTERRALDRQRESPDYSFRLAFLRQVKQAINQQAASLNADAARVKSVERSMKTSQSRHHFDASAVDWWNSFGGDFGSGGGGGGGGGRGVVSGWGDVSEDNQSDVSSTGLTSDTDTTVGSCATMNKVKHTLGAAFGPAMALQQLQERARYRRAVRQQHKIRDSDSHSKIHYPSRPPARSERLMDARERGSLRYDNESVAPSPRPRLSRFRQNYAVYAGSGVGAGAAGSSWTEQHRMAVLQNQIMKLAAQRELQREGFNRHGSWLSLFRDRIGRNTTGDDGLPYMVHGGAGGGGGGGRESRDKENRPNVVVAGAGGGGGEGTKMNLGDGKSIVIRIETASQ